MQHVLLPSLECDSKECSLVKKTLTKCNQDACLSISHLSTVLKVARKIVACDIVLLKLLKFYMFNKITKTYHSSASKSEINLLTLDEGCV